MQAHLYTAVLLGAVRTTRPTKLSEVYAVELASGVKPLRGGAADLPHRVLHLARQGRGVGVVGEEVAEEGVLVPHRPLNEVVGGVLPSSFHV